MIISSRQSWQILSLFLKSIFIYCTAYNTVKSNGDHQNISECVCLDNDSADVVGINMSECIQ